MGKVIKGRKLVRHIPKEGAKEVVQKLNKDQKKWIYFWDDIKGTIYRGMVSVGLYRIPNEDYRKPVARRHVDE